MTLDEAIIHCQEKSCGDTECAREHKQMSEWLVELKQRREQEEPVSEELKNAALEYATHYDKNWSEVKDGYIAENEVEAFKAGAKWQKAHLLKPADSDDLPRIDREVIALFDKDKIRYIGYAHRPLKYWDGKNIVTDKVTQHYPKTYDKGGWNVPNVKYWLDVELPKETEI